ncbi:MAG: carotenoid oxygenase family protein [Acidimicrobiales bacterium]
MDTEEISEKIPFHLKGNYAPVDREVSETALEVIGNLPRELSGRFFRNGPNPKSGTSGHWFVGDGMIHGIRLRDGKADWYRNRWVETRALLEPDVSMRGDDGVVDRTIGVNNTHIVGHAGKILSLVESSFPCELSADLDTVGVHDFAGQLKTAMTAHPKICPVTGEMHFFGYDQFEPYLTYHRANAAGELVQTEAIDVVGPTMIHDFAITDRHIIFMDLPVVFDLEQAMSGRFPYGWDEDYGARVGVMARATDDETATGTPVTQNTPVQWFEVDPCYVFHPMNAFVDADDQVVVDTARYARMWDKSASDFRNDAFLHRWSFDLATNSVSETQLDDRALEFPRIAEHLTGLPNRFGYGTSGTEGTALAKYDLQASLGSSSSDVTAQVKEFGPNVMPGEPVFVPAENAESEDHGWLMTYTFDKSDESSQFVVLDARDISGEPVATVRLPQRVPFGFHGSWFDDADYPQTN